MQRRCPPSTSPRPERREKPPQRWQAQDFTDEKTDSVLLSVQSVKKVAAGHFFEDFRLSLSPYGSRAGKPVKLENLAVFIRSDAHVVRAGLNVKGCGPSQSRSFF